MVFNIVKFTVAGSLGLASLLTGYTAIKVAVLKEEDTK